MKHLQIKSSQNTLNLPFSYSAGQLAWPLNSGAESDFGQQPIEPKTKWGQTSS